METGRGQKALSKGRQRDEGLLKEELGTLAHREKAAEHAVDVVSAGQIVSAVTVITSVISSLS